MIPILLESLQKPMQKHHPVVKDENYNLYSDHITKVVEFVTVHVLQHTPPGKKKYIRLYDIDSTCYLLPFSQSHLILTISSLTFFSFSDLPTI